MLRKAFLLIALATSAHGTTLLIRRPVRTGPALGREASDSRIFGGHGAQPGQFPYVVSLQLAIAGNRYHNCGGSIITTTSILTAAHCVSQDQTYYAVAGEHDFTLDEGTEQDVLVTEQIPHPQYNNTHGIGANDVAIFKLESALTLNSYVQIINLPSAGIVPEAETNATISGWGYLESGFPPEILQTVDVTIFDNVTCEEHFEELGLLTSQLTETMVCTGPFFAGIAICAGDSGGPLEQSGLLVGVVSFSPSPCTLPGAAALHTRVSAFLDFISDNV